ncbi:MAG: GGDEF domain-containing protein [Lachnospiraceae bacterium]|nr:GGDEF domain-containing protein [Lachnospiraceae bacterium]
MINGTKIVALCTSRIYDPQLQGFVELLNESLKECDIRLWIYAINADIYWEERTIPAEVHVFDYIHFNVVDAVVIMDEKIKSHIVAERILHDSRSHGVPVIVVDGKYEGAVSISYDYAAGFEQIVRHVIRDHGVRKPHYMAGFRDNPFSEERKAVFRKVIGEYGIDFDEETMVSYGEFWATPARAAAQKLLDEDRLPEAIICANDIMAINVCDVIREAGFRVPEDCIVTGFDGYDEALENEPGITTASCRTQGLAETVKRAIIECFGGMAEDTYTVLPVMIPNESCGCPRCADLDRAQIRHFNNNFYRFQDDIRVYQAISVDMQSSATNEQMMICLHSYFTRNMCCIVDEDCFRNDINFFLESHHSGKYKVLYDSLHYSDYPDPFDPKDVVPEFEERMAPGYPLIFNSLDYMDVPFGYVCYMFENYDIIDYSKTSSLTNTVNTGLGGYVSMQYQHYLMAEVEKMYKTDALTGLYNRLAAHEAYEAVKSDPVMYGKELTVIMADLDGLKQINDSLGHAAGDKAIAAVAHSLRDACPQDAICVRFGGDEMVAFVVGDCDCEKILEQIRESLARKSWENGFKISASCGCHTTRITRNLDIERILRRADEQMYRDKTAHKG